MMQSGRILLLGGGLIAVVLTAFLLGGSFREPAHAQVPAVAPPAGIGRYQISSFMIQQLTPGAYILDTQTGDVFQVVGKERPERIGSVTQAAPKK